MSASLEKKLLDIRRKVLKPAPKMNLVEWADTYRFLSPESSSTPGKWRTSLVEPARGPMLAVTEPGVKRISIMACTQLMKALDINEVLPTPEGWTTVKDVKVGDILFDENGNKCSVLGKSDIVKNQTAIVKFSDGAEVICDLGHRWTVNDYKKPKDIVTKTLTTKELMESFKMTQRRNRYSINIAKAIELDKKELPIDPYVLGYWLGDGHSYSSGVTCSIFDFDSMESHFNSRGYKLLKSRSDNPRVFQSRIHDKDGTIHSKLKNLNVLKNKHIPNLYLRSSIKDRVDLLCGLMDSDGTVNKDGSNCSITIKREEFCDSFVELCLSLGIRTKKSSCAVLYKGEWRNYYVCRFTSYSTTKYFNLKRKQDRVNAKNKLYSRFSDSFERRIVDIKLHDIRDVQCIMVDSPSHLFLCSRAFIPTHNTELLNNIIGYFISNDPCPIILMQPTVSLAETFSRDRLDPMLRDTPILRGLVKDKKSRDSGNTLHYKKFPGGGIYMIGSNSPSELASRPIRVVLRDEVDKYVSDAKEGSPSALIAERSATFWNSLNIGVCSPTIKGRSEIESEYLNSDQRKYYVDCPHCKHNQVMQWENVRWDKDEPNTAAYQCTECTALWSEVDRIKAINSGRYIATQPFNGHAGFWINKLSSPWEPLSALVSKYLACGNDQDKLKTFVNTQLAQTWEEKGEAPEHIRLYERREPYDIGSVPEGVHFLTAGVDVQKDRLELEIVGWGKGKESWSIEYRVIMGETTTEEPWKELDKVLNETWELHDGRITQIKVMAVDSGYNTQHVYNWCRKYSANRVMPVKGSDTQSTILNIPKATDVKHSGKKVSNGVRVWTVGVSLLKTELYGYLNLNGAGDDGIYPEGYCHFPQYSEEYFRMITAEQLMKRQVNGKTNYVWVKTYERNEALDCRNYARAAAAMIGIDRFKEKDWLNFAGERKEKPVIVEKKQPDRKSYTNKPNPFLGGKKSFW